MRKVKITKEQLIEEYINKNKNFREISKECGLSPAQLCKNAKKWGIKIRKGKLNLIGKTYGKLQVVDYVGIDCNKRSIWLCICECGNKVERGLSSLTGGSATHCGCSRIKVFKKHKKWNDYNGIDGYFWANLQFGAKKRNLEFSITPEYIYKLYLEQDKKCKYSKIPITFGKKTACTVSVDRIDSKLPYIEGNIQLIHKAINKMKMDFKDRYFVNMCRLIGENSICEQREKEVFHAHLDWEYSGGLAVYQELVKQQKKLIKQGELMTKEQLKERIQSFLSFGEILAKATKNPQDDQIVKFLQTILSSDVTFDVLYFVYTKLFNKETMKFDKLQSFLSANSD